MAKATGGPSCAGLGWASLGFAFSPALFGSRLLRVEFCSRGRRWVFGSTNIVDVTRCLVT